ncbi:DNA-processing protein DprA [Parabacteroides sp. Marseille-P3160]|uniref:DNA-processing protein DprA n=1 Tax=Parabacteroides sp. Marseille-P3160 TaxID=1917887 RepID=UPI0009BA9FA4|nr:DNA-processing protein DprA [Parabacteroides sp. Marseille-P3160]
MTDKRIYQIGLTMINGVGDILARHLLQYFGDAEAVFTEKKQLLEKVPGIGESTAAAIRQPGLLARAEKELAFVEANHISTFFLTDEAYPTRLRECPDAPVLFYFKGNANLQARHILSIVGTRSITPYGKELTDVLIRDLAAVFPDLLIVSGLAYGVDVQAHRRALANQLPTVGVLAHGLDRIYPPVHRSTAVEMLKQGGLLTDFPSGTNPDKPNFLKRNRLIAGLADATVVVESAERGGSLVTADLALSYGREVYTFPGRTGDIRSKGCNELIRRNKAGLITSAANLIESLNWALPKKTPPSNEEPQLPFNNAEETHPVLKLFHEKKEVQIDLLAVELGLPVQQLSSILFELEMDGKIKSLPGGIYRIIGD